MTGILTKTKPSVDVTTTDLAATDLATTDLDAYVNAQGRDELVKQVRAKINELGIEYIYYQFISVTGRITGKGAPADHWETMVEKGIQLVYGATVNLALGWKGCPCLWVRRWIVWRGMR